MSGNKDSENVGYAEDSGGLSQQRLRNRLAQRKYRESSYSHCKAANSIYQGKKVKQRIEDLEKRAAGYNDAGSSEPTTSQAMAQGSMEQPSPKHHATEPAGVISGLPPVAERLFDGKQGSLSTQMERDTLQDQQFNQAMNYDFRLSSSPALNAWQGAADLSNSGDPY